MRHSRNAWTQAPPPTPRFHTRRPPGDNTRTTASEQAIKLGRNDDVALLQPSEQRPAFLSLSHRHRAGDALLDHGLIERQPVHVGIALDLPALDVEAFAFVGLPQRRNPAISVNRHYVPCQFVSVQHDLGDGDGFVNVLEHADKSANSRVSAGGKLKRSAS
jgi:hypothetical protein